MKLNVILSLFLTTLLFCESNNNHTTSVCYAESEAQKCFREVYSLAIDPKQPEHIYLSIRNGGTVFIKVRMVAKIGIFF